MKELRKIELLSPAANAEIAREAILHGADAIYIGGPGYGARKAAANSIADIASLVEFAHRYRVRVYITVNTIIYESELKAVERMIADLYRVGVDAIIVQDMGILRLDIPPIELHASTQCDTRSVAKARFLQDSGFSQIVLARELTLKEISGICHSVDVPVETFVHGALCVSYSGRCHASQACFGRSANRGECAQICRLPFDLVDASGNVLRRRQHLLSLKDLNASDRLSQLLEAGVSSFKIEGRLKDADYVKNTTAAYRHMLDEEIAAHPDIYTRSSVGMSSVDFIPSLDKSFNRGFTHYFLDSRRPDAISQPRTPKSMGETIKDISQLHNGDGISFFNERGEYEGAMVNGVSGSRIIGNRPFRLPQGGEIHRTFDIRWQQRLAKPTARRNIDVDIELDAKGVSVRDERGLTARVSLDFTPQTAKNSIKHTTGTRRRPFEKLGNTPYRLRSFSDNLSPDLFIPLSVLTDARRRMLELLNRIAIATYPFTYRRSEKSDVLYPSGKLDFRDNVANSLAEKFYRNHGVNTIDRALECREFHGNVNAADGIIVMTTRHCILREGGWCRKNGVANKSFSPKLPLYLESNDMRFRLDFDCERCEMHVLSSAKASSLRRKTNNNSNIKIKKNGR